MNIYYEYFGTMTLSVMIFNITTLSTVTLNITVLFVTIIITTPRIQCRYANCHFYC
jgi:hypothetical protein